MPAIWFILVFFVIFLLTLLMWLFQEEKMVENEFILNVECGFLSMLENQVKFSNQFFMIALIFVVFDMELVIIFPLPILFSKISVMLVFSSILIFLIISLLMEILNGLIYWVK